MAPYGSGARANEKARRRASNSVAVSFMRGCATDQALFVPHQEFPSHSVSLALSVDKMKCYTEEQC